MIEVFVAKIAEEIHNHEKLFHPTTDAIDAAPDSSIMKADKIEQIIRMARASARFTKNIRMVRDISYQAFDPKSEVTAEDLKIALQYNSAFALDFDYMIQKTSSEKKIYQAIDMSRIDPALHIYLQHPATLEIIKLASQTLKTENISAFILTLDRIDPDILKKFLNEAPVELDFLSDITTLAVNAGYDFTKELLDRGWDPNSVNRNIAAEPFSSAIIVAIENCNSEVVKLILEQGFNKDRPQFLMDKEVDPLEFANEESSKPSPEKTEEFKQIVEALEDHYKKTPSPSPSEPKPGNSTEKTKGGQKA